LAGRAEDARGVANATARRLQTVIKSPTRDISFLLVEDEALIRMMVSGMIEELGHTVAAEAGNIADALNLAQSADFRVAILDINLAGHRIDPVAEIIERRGLPFIFSSGYGAKGLPAKFYDRPVLQKPFLIERLVEAIEAAVGGTTSL
jgi:CheY-like chemotaxis protein